MTADRLELLQGTLEMLVRRTLSVEPMHGWGIAHRIAQMSSQVFDVNQGSIYPALQRMKVKGWVRSEWRLTENRRKARYYELTRAGEEQLARERSDWERASAAVNGILTWRESRA